MSERRVHVFAGPSLPNAARPSLEGLVFHGPVVQGDVYALVPERPLAIAIVDGYFERVPAVWHKEILWALAEGVHVFGAASMGALRAAELAPFGMVGVGKIYEDFARGALTDDDEVTIVHADAAFGYRASSEAMVNIRATLHSAVKSGILTQPQAQRLIERTKAQFYPDRNYPGLIAMARDELEEKDCERLGRWLRAPGNTIDQKQLDALELLRVLADFREGKADPARVPWTFQHTDAWEQVRRTIVQGRWAEVSASHGGDSAWQASAPPKSEELVLRARLRGLEVRSARADGYKPSPNDIGFVTAEFCRARGLLSEEALQAFLKEIGLAPAEFERLMTDEAYARRARLVPEYDLSREMAALSLLDARRSP